MGAIATLLLLPVMAPVWGFRFVLERLGDEADAVMHDEGRAFAELIDLSMRRSAGRLSDAEYAEQEAAVLERLSAIREQRDELLDDDMDLDADEWHDADSDADEAMPDLAEAESC